MNTVELITKKREGLALTADEIEYLVKGYTAGDIPDYQMSAFLMAVYFNGMDKVETVALTKIMKESGDIVDLSVVIFSFSHKNNIIFVIKHINLKFSAYV